MMYNARLRYVNCFVKLLTLVVCYRCTAAVQANIAETW